MSVAACLRSGPSLLEKKVETSSWRGSALYLNACLQFIVCRVYRSICRGEGYFSPTIAVSSLSFFLFSLLLFRVSVFVLNGTKLATSRCCSLIVSLFSFCWFDRTRTQGDLFDTILPSFFLLFSFSIFSFRSEPYRCVFSFFCNFDTRWFVMTGNGIGDCIFEVCYICLYDWRKIDDCSSDTFDAVGDFVTGQWNSV